MVEVIDGLWVSGDEGVPDAKKRNMAICAVCKEGPDGHRSALKYHTLGAPKDKNYYFYEKGDHLYVNLLDSEDPNFIPEQAINAALKFIKAHRDKGEQVLVHCNRGRSRGPTTAMMYLRTIGEMPYHFVQAEKVMRTLYPKFDPGEGMRIYARQHWAELAPKGE